MEYTSLRNVSFTHIAHITHKISNFHIMNGETIMRFGARIYSLIVKRSWTGLLGHMAERTVNLTIVEFSCLFGEAIGDDLI